MRRLVRATLLTWTIAVMAATPAMAGTLDQQQLTYGAADLGLNGPDRVAAQTFTAGLTGRLDQVDLPIGYTVGCQPVGDLIVQIQSVTNNLPSGSVLASTAVPSSALGEQAAGMTPFVPITFALPASVTAGTPYAIVLVAPQAGTCGVPTAYYEWQLGSGNPYAPGAAWFSNTGGATFVPFGDTDAGFRTYVTPPDTDPPSAELSKTPKKKSKSRTATFKFGSDEPGVTFQCRLDKKAFKPCASPRKYRKLKVRKHKFRLVATDGAGNASAETTFRWRVVD